MYSYDTYKNVYMYTTVYEIVATLQLDFNPQL